MATNFLDRYFDAVAPFCLLAVCTILLNTAALRAEPWSTQSSRQDKEASQIVRVLEKRVSLDFSEIPLTDFADFLRDHYKINVRIDKNALRDVGLDERSPIRGQFQQTKLKHALAHILRDLNLTYTADRGILLITTAERDDSTTRLGIYNVQQLLGRDETAKDIARLITQVLDPKQNDAHFRIEARQHTLIVRGSHLSHESLVVFLDMLSNALNQNLSQPKTITLESRGPDQIVLHKAIEFKIDRPATEILLSENESDPAPVRLAAPQVFQLETQVETPRQGVTRASHNKPLGKEKPRKRQPKKLKKQRSSNKVRKTKSAAGDVTIREVHDHEQREEIIKKDGLEIHRHIEHDHKEKIRTIRKK